MVWRRDPGGRQAQHRDGPAGDAGLSDGGSQSLSAELGDVGTRLGPPAANVCEQEA